MFNKNKVFIVEDDPVLFKAYEEMFKSKNLNVSGTSNAAEAVPLITSQRPNIILLDIMLAGGINGFDVLRELKKDPEIQNIPVVVLTNLDSEEKTAVELGAKAYLVKANTNKNEIIETVMKCLQ